MKKLLFAGLCMAALVTSCSNDLTGDSTHSVELSASVGAENTRAAFLESGEFYWQTGDKIGVITKTNDGTNTKFTPLALQTGATTGSATFKGIISGSLGDYAIYPYSDAQKIDNGKLSYTFPSEYTYDKVDDTFFPTAKDGNSFNPAMLANISGNSVAFKHLGGVFCIRVESMPCASGTLTLATTQSLCGTYTTDVTATTPELVSSSTAATDANTKVTIKFSGATQGQTGVFYIPAPTGTYTDATITFKDANNKETKVVAGVYKVERSYLKELVLKEVTISAETVTEAKSTSDAETALAEKNNVAVTSEVSNATITIPETKTTESTTSTAKTLTLQKVADNATIKVADKNTSTESTDASKSVKELTVSIPNTTDATKAPTVEVSMPNSTVTLAGNAGEATFKQVTASTAENTLVVSNGVTIEKLIVAKGNVRVNKGATVKAIELASSNNSAIVYYENGASLGTLGNGITTNGYIETEAQFAAAMAKSGNYTLLKDLTLSKAYTVASTLDLDLNKKTLTSSYAIETIGGNFNLHNGNVVQHKGDDKVGLHVGTNGTLIIDDVTYTGDKASFNRIYVIECQKTVNLTIKNSTINGGYYALSTNASTTSGVTSPCTITLENSKFLGVETGAMININATTTIKDCEFSGNHQGALFRGGTYTISGSTFTLNAELPFSDVENMWMKEWKDGNRCAYAALTIGNHEHTAYQYPTNITFESAKSTAQVIGTNVGSFPNVHICANQTDNLGVTIKGWSNTITPSTSYGYTLECGTKNIVIEDHNQDKNTEPYYKGCDETE